MRLKWILKAIKEPLKVTDGRSEENEGYKDFPVIYPHLGKETNLLSGGSFFLFC